jgi:hypothetical protein
MNEALVEQPVNFLQLQQSLNDRGKKEQKYKIFGVIFFTVAVCSVIANPNDYIPGCEENSVACSYVPLWGFLASWTAMIIACASGCRQQHLAQQTAQQMEYFLQQISSGQTIDLEPGFMVDLDKDQDSSDEAPLLTSTSEGNSL